MNSAAAWVRENWDGALNDPDHLLTSSPKGRDDTGRYGSIKVIRFPDPTPITEIVLEIAGAESKGQSRGLILVGFPPIGWHSTPLLYRTLASIPDGIGLEKGYDEGSWFALILNQSGHRAALSDLLHQSARTLDDSWAAISSVYSALNDPSQIHEVLSERFLTTLSQLEDALPLLEAKHNRATTQIERLTRGMERRERDLARLKETVERLREVASTYRYERDIERWELRSLRASRWWRFGRAFHRLVQNPLHPVASLRSLAGVTETISPEPKPERAPIHLSWFNTEAEDATASPEVQAASDPDEMVGGVVRPGDVTLTNEELNGLREAFLKASSPTELIQLLDTNLEGRDSQTQRRILRRASRAAAANGWMSERMGITTRLAAISDRVVDKLEHASALFDEFLLPEAIAIANEIAIESNAPAVADLTRNIRDFGRLVDELAWADSPTKRRHTPVSARVVTFLHSSLPYLNGGYATRAHGLMNALIESGVDMVVYTRPGFPKDLVSDSTNVDRISFFNHDTIDRVGYRRILGTTDRTLPEPTYMLETADVFEAILAEERPLLVHGRSTHLVALPALIAARRQGLPYIYEISGLLELVWASRTSSSHLTPKFQRTQYLETLVAKEADHVFVLTDEMASLLATRGVDRGKVSVVPNSVASTVSPLERDEVLGEQLGLPPDVPVIGYLGAFQDYEGLDDLLDAMKTLAGEGIEFRSILVGDGPATQQLHQKVLDLGLSGQVQVLKRVPFEQVGKYYSLIDLVVFPRKPWLVCETVAPMKPLEAMALRKAILVSDVGPLNDLVTHGVTGLTFQKGNTDDLTAQLRVMIQDSDLRERLGREARDWVLAHRTWKQAAEVVVEAYERLLGKRMSRT